MKERGISKSNLITFGIIILVFSLAAYILFKDNSSSEISENLAKCIGEHSELYVQTGCLACVRQEELFGKEAKHLNKIDCFLLENRQTCFEKNIEATPTWIINGEKYRGAQSIETLKALTNC